MRFVEFRRFLNDDNALRVQFEVDSGQVLKFVVQLECRFGDKTWTPVIRYDTAHGFAHCDKLHPYESAIKTKMETKDCEKPKCKRLGLQLAQWVSPGRSRIEHLKSKEAGLSSPI